uniref:Uncharacterized protein n=1 Tax=Parascaris univalens TaxID=6257 RepID=A0A915A657_PARUN
MYYMQRNLERLDIEHAKLELSRNFSSLTALPVVSTDGPNVARIDSLFFSKAANSAEKQQAQKIQFRKKKQRFIEWQSRGEKTVTEAELESGNSIKLELYIFRLLGF